jgi:Fe-S cluster assembly iron-binding protein IscA
MSLQITNNAQAHLIRVRRERGIDDRHAARFVDNHGKVRLTFAPTAAPGDREVSAREIRVLVAQEIADRLERAVIDARKDDDKDVLVIKRATGAAQS